MPLSLVPIWKEAPFLRLLPPFITGILLQWYIELPLPLITTVLAITILALLALQSVSVNARFTLGRVAGILLHLALVLLGSIITYYKHPANTPGWLAAAYAGQGSVKAVLQEPPTAKARSFKALAAARQLQANDTIVNVNGNIIVYFSPKVKLTDLSYGSIIIINKPLLPVKNSGNPGAFDYQRYCTFEQIGYQVYLKPEDFIVSTSKEKRYLQTFILFCRQKVLNILHTYIQGGQERALAEALLIGYKDELDKNLAQSYANTGVIHIIAVSGMHLGIIYCLLSWLIQPLRKHRHTKWFSFIFILAGLWIFSLLAGAGPSVVRSALMFSFIVIGDTFSKRSTIYNNLAASAFLLLCWNPFWLWDAGFQLSYAAVLSIVLFFRPVYNLLYVRNKLLDALWKLNAVTIAAQMLTLPFSVYHFHQFPNLFLFANLIAVPLSSILLIGEILLCIFSFIPLVASWIGAGLSFLIGFLNNFIQHIDALPFASWTHLQLNVLQAALLFAFITAAAGWLMQRSKPALITALCSLSFFMLMRGYSFITAANQHKLIVYNIPQRSAIDFIEGRHYYFAGDHSVEENTFLRNYHLEPSRIIHRISSSDTLPGLLGKGPLFLFHGKRVLIADTALQDNYPTGFRIDLLIISNNPRISLPHLLQQVQPAQVIADGSNPTWKTKQWQQDCKALRIPFHSVTDNGAFILNTP